LIAWVKGQSETFSISTLEGKLIEHRGESTLLEIFLQIAAPAVRKAEEQ